MPLKTVRISTKDYAYEEVGTRRDGRTVTTEVDHTTGHVYTEGSRSITTQFPFRITDDSKITEIEPDDSIVLRVQIDEQHDIHVVAVPGNEDTSRWRPREEGYSPSLSIVILPSKKDAEDAGVEEPGIYLFAGDAQEPIGYFSLKLPKQKTYEETPADKKDKNEDQNEHES